MGIGDEFRVGRCVWMKQYFKQSRMKIYFEFLFSSFGSVILSFIPRDRPLGGAVVFPPEVARSFCTCLREWDNAVQGGSR